MSTSQAVTEIPENLKRPGAKDSLIIFKNNNEKEFENSMKKCVSILDETMNEEDSRSAGRLNYFEKIPRTG